MRPPKQGRRSKGGQQTPHRAQTPGPAQTGGRLQRTLGNDATRRLVEAGNPLPADVRAQMETGFGHDFGAVRVHTGADAAMAAKAANAKAYTIGQHIVFGNGHYAPGTNAGEHLLAHELAHVVQQSRGGAAPSAQSDGLLEAGADNAASAVTQGQTGVHVSGAAAEGMSRQPDDADEERRRKSDAPAADDNAPQANLPQTTLLNGPFFGGHNPIGTLSTDLFGIFGGQSATDPAVGRTYIPSFQLQVRDRLTATGELGFFGTLGGTVPASNPGAATGSGALGLSWHGGPESPGTTDRYTFGLGYFLTLGQYWGQEPPTPGAAPAPRGWSFNPVLNAMLSLGWAREGHGEFDLVFGGGIGRWGQVNGVPVGAAFSPYVGVSYTGNLTDNDTLTVEGSIGTNLGLAGRFDDGHGFPASLAVAGGIAYQHLWGDWGFGIEPWVFAEPASTVSTPAAPGLPAGRDSNFGLGLRFNLTAINPRRKNIPEDR